MLHRTAVAVRGFVLISIILVITAAGAQNPPTVTAQANTVYVSAEGTFDAAPDTALVQFNISAPGDTAKAAYERASQAAEQVRQLLRNTGIDVKQAQFGYFSLNPVYDYRRPERKIISYRVNSNVSVKLKDFTKVGAVVEHLATLDVTSNQSLNYILENTDAAKLKAIDDAFQRARNEATAIAHAGDRTLGELAYASVDTQEQIRPMFAMRAAAVAGAAEKAPTEEFTPQNVTVTARVNAVFALK